LNNKILIVDDEPNIVKLLGYRLSFNGYDVLKAYNGLECITIAKSYSPDLVLLDIHMPKCDGISTFNKMFLDDRTREIPVIFMTSFTRDYSKLHLLNLGAKGFVSKPINCHELRTYINNILN
jgi:two-component system alkaline phosphatase synthesis response regulator PhoP